MARTVRLAVLLALFLVPMLSGCLGQFLTGELADPVPAPDFSLTDTEGRTWNLTDLQGHVVLIDFMGTWCGPCQRAVPVLRDFQEDYPNLVVLSVSSTDDEDQLRDFQGQHGADWPHIADDGRMVESFREAGSSAPAMLWPSYAIIDQDGMLRFYNRGETLPATFTAALDDVTQRTGPAIGAEGWRLLAASFLLGVLAWSNPFLLRYTWQAEAPRAPRTWILPIAIYGLIGVLAAYASRPLSGRVATIAPFLAVGAVLAIIVWRWKGTASVQADGKRLRSEEPWWHAAAFWGNTLWYLLPIWATVLHAAMLRTRPMETLWAPVLFGVGLVAAESLAHRRQVQQRVASWGPAAGWIGASALLVAALWNGLLYIR